MFMFYSVAERGGHFKQTKLTGATDWVMSLLINGKLLLSAVRFLASIQLPYQSFCC